MVVVRAVVRVVVEVVKAVREREKEEKGYVPEIVVLTFLPRHYIWK